MGAFGDCLDSKSLTREVVSAEIVWLMGLEPVKSSILWSGEGRRRLGLDEIDTARVGVALEVASRAAT